MNSIIMGLQTALMPLNFIMIISGTFLGIVVGAIPGLNGPMAIVLLAPFTFTMPFTAGFLMAVGIYCGQLFGGSISAILFKAPGTAVAAATVIDGYEASKCGNAEKALRTAIFSSAIGGLFSLIVLMIFAPILAKFALLFSSAEYFSFAFFGLCVISSAVSEFPLKGLVMMLVGLLLTTVGVDSMSGVVRFTFGYEPFLVGFSMVPVLIGLYPLAEVFTQIVKPTLRDGLSENTVKIKKSLALKLNKKVWNEIWNLRDIIFRSSIIGTLIGLLPGAGGTTAAFLAYSNARSISKDKNKFGKGCMEGIAAPEAANNASSGGAMIPLLTLGIPGSLTTAVMLGLFIQHGLQPGPLLFLNQKELVYTIFGGLFLSNLLILPGGIYGAKLFSSFLRISPRLIYPTIFVIGITGAFSVRNSYVDIWVAISLAIIGYFFNSYKWPVAPLVVGMVLGKLAESTFRGAMISFNNNALMFFTRPVSAIMLIAAFLSLIWPLMRYFIRRYDVLILIKKLFSSSDKKND